MPNPPIDPEQLALDMLRNWQDNPSRMPSVEAIGLGQLAATLAVVEQLDRIARILALGAEVIEE